MAISISDCRPGASRGGSAAGGGRCSRMSQLSATYSSLSLLLLLLLLRRAGESGGARWSWRGACLCAWRRDCTRARETARMAAMVKEREGRERRETKRGARR